MAASLAALIVLICTVNSLRWVNRPFPGFFLWENLLVPAVGATNWTGYEAGLPYHSRLIVVEGRPVTSAAEVYRTAAGVPVGTAISYTFAVEHRAAPVTLTIPTMRLSIRDYLWTLGNYVGIGALLTFLGIVVYLLRPDAPGARGMLSAAGTWGLYFATAADIFGPAWFRPLCLLLQAVSPVALLHLALTFPVERRILQRHRRLLPSLYLAALLIGLVDNLIFARWFTGMLVLNRLHGFASGLAGLVLIGLLAQSFFVPPSAAARQRTKIAALGGLAAFIIPTAGAALFSLGGATFPLNFLAVPLVLFPIAIGYAIVKHDLFEVDAIIRRTVAWAVLTALVAAVYIGGVGTLEVFFTVRTGRVVQVLFLLVIVLLFNPLRDRVQATVDFLFARDRYDYRRTLGQASQALASLLDREAVVGRIMRTITGTMHVDFGAVWLRQDDGYALQAVAGSDKGSVVPERLDGSSALVCQLQENPRHILADDGSGGQDDPVRGELARLGVTLVVPMTFERRLTGFLGLGGKESGGFYSREDVGLLRTLANQGALAVENARSYQALARANEELRAAQSRLIEAERFAAIGELSAAVAHGIRNPVAGIKAAAQFANMELHAGHPLRENIADIISEADKLEARIKTLLDFAKPFEPHPTPCRVDEIVGGAVAFLRNEIAAQGVELVTDLDPALPVVDLDYAQVEQVLLALLSNAVEAMPRGGRATLTARLAAGGGSVQLEVADTGPGIPADQLPCVFDLFFTTKSSGSGFGLAVAKKIVERHGGTITVESHSGRGSRFRIELPLRKPRVKLSCGE